MESSFFTGCIFRIWNRNYKLIKHQHKSSNNVSYYWSDCSVRSLGTNMVLWRLSAREWKLSGERNWQVWHLTWDERNTKISHLTGSRSDLHHYSVLSHRQTLPSSFYLAGKPRTRNGKILKTKLYYSSPQGVGGNGGWWVGDGTSL